VADHPLRPATDRRLGKPLPHQLANRTQAILKAPGPKVPSFPPQSLCGISLSFPKLSHTSRYIPTRYSPVRHSPPTPYQVRGRAAVRLACVRHAASVQSEPGSNSSVQFLAPGRFTILLSWPKSLDFLRSVAHILTCMLRYGARKSSLFGSS
jgi:hypothetical protein